MSRSSGVFVMAAMFGAIACSSSSNSGTSPDGGGGAGGPSGSGGPGGGSTYAPSASDCKSACARIAVPKCPKDDPTTCESACAKLVDIAPTACKSEWSAYLQCGMAAQTWACDTNGEAAPQGCDTQATAVATCAKANAGDSGGSGSGGTSSDPKAACSAAGGFIGVIPGDCTTSCSVGTVSTPGRCNSGWTCNIGGYCALDANDTCLSCAIAK